MKRHNVLLTLIVLGVLCTTALAQDPVQTPFGQRDGATAVGNPLELMALLAQRGGGQRSGGPRGDGQAVSTPFGVAARAGANQAAWWTDTRLVAQLGLTEEQKSRIERTFEAHRQTLATATEQLQREEAQLARMLEAESVDRAGVNTQVNRVIQARGEVERTNSAMTLEMREQLSRSQWMQLQSSQNLTALRVLTATPVAPPPQGAPGARGGRGGPAAPQGLAVQPPPPGAPLRIGAQVAQSNLVSSVPPTYPPLARNARVTDDVVLEATISKEGTVTDLKVVNGHPLLNDAAVAAVKQWRYRPQFLNGEPVSVITNITVTFPTQ